MLNKNIMSLIGALLFTLTFSLRSLADDVDVYIGTDINGTFISPIVELNQFKRLTHGNQVYFALFKSSKAEKWQGNIKKYKIKGKQIIDRHGENAIDNQTGFFSENSHSYWSKIRDGSSVSKGGATSRLNRDRSVYFFDSSGSVLLPKNMISETNANISARDLGIENSSGPASKRAFILKWIKGQDVNDDNADSSTSDASYQMGVPLHSQPLLVSYSESDSALFVATNHGFLHSFDTKTGEENFALMPKSLLKNLSELYRNDSPSDNMYGLDGDLVYREYDDKKYIYFGMRRGGSNYYAVDVSDKLDPKVVFIIEGGHGKLINLGQSWSRPIITKVKIGSTVKDVMIVGGGYDEAHDNKIGRSKDNIGNAVFMLDAKNGQLLWSASRNNADLSLPDMKYSVPASVAVIDRNKDNLADHMYVADLGGQIFRLDINNGQEKTDLVTGKLIAQLAGDTPQTNRRFFNAPDITAISNAQEHYLALVIGSGFRADPLSNTTEDAFFMLKDKSVFDSDNLGNRAWPSPPISTSRLYDATEHLLTSDDEHEKARQLAMLAAKDGWMIRLNRQGEKVLTSPLIMNYRILFSTYLPVSNSQLGSMASAGKSRAYLINLIDANALLDLNKNNVKDARDRFALLKQSGIAPDAKIFIQNPFKPIVCIAAECAFAVSQVDPNGDSIPCSSDFKCLAAYIFGKLERVQKIAWKTDVERK